MEVHTYDASQFQEFHPESLAVGEAVWAFLEKAAKVGYQNLFVMVFSVCVCVWIRIPRICCLIGIQILIWFFAGRFYVPVR